jgi:hypothetical protein
MPMAVVYANEDLIDLENLRQIRDSLETRCQNVDGKAKIAELSYLIQELEGGAVRPNEKTLCERYASGAIEARTVCHITKWSMVELYDRCRELGFSFPGFGD